MSAGEITGACRSIQLENNVAVFEIFRSDYLC